VKILLVVAHERTNSLTREVAEQFASAARENGHEIELADLVAEGFDPVLREADEPDWDDPDKIYSEAVRAEMARIERNETTVMVFPVWWWSMPAILKGWIDRVWNNGWAYGEKTYPHKRVLMIGIAGNDQESYEKRDYDKAMQTGIVTGILDFCGVEDAKLELLYGALEDADAPARTLKAANALGADF